MIQVKTIEKVSKTIAPRGINPGIMNRQQLRNYRLGVLIDADNASAQLIEPILNEVAKYGDINAKRIYGDWSSPRLNKWKEQLHGLGIQPIQQCSYVAHKNATDIALVIDAMDLLYGGKFDGICIISSDSDYTRLALRLREAGLFVYGFGRANTPISFQKACSLFTPTELFETHLKPGQSVETNDTKIKSEEPLAKQKDTKGKASAQKEVASNQELVNLLKSAYKSAPKSDGWVSISVFGSQIRKTAKNFEAKTYGFKQLGQLVKSLKIFEAQDIPSKKNSSSKVLHIKLKT